MQAPPPIIALLCPLSSVLSPLSALLCPSPLSSPFKRLLGVYGNGRGRCKHRPLLSLSSVLSVLSPLGVHERQATAGTATTARGQERTGGGEGLPSPPISLLYPKYISALLSALLSSAVLCCPLGVHEVLSFKKAVGGIWQAKGAVLAPPPPVRSPLLRLSALLSFLKGCGGIWHYMARHGKERTATARRGRLRQGEDGYGKERTIWGRGASPSPPISLLYPHTALLRLSFLKGLGVRSSF